MINRTLLKQVGFKIIHLLALICLVTLVNPVQCGIDFKYFGEPNGEHLFRTDKDVVITYYWDYRPQQLESYTVSVGHSKNGQEIWNNTIVLNDQTPGEHSPINGTFGSPNLGKMDAAQDYYVSLITKPVGTARRVSYSEPFTVTPNPGKITIIKFNDKNGNLINDSGEEGLGGAFEIRNDLGYYQSVTVNSDGILSIPLNPGQYRITESPQSCWKPTNDAVQQITVGPGETKLVYFGNKIDAELTITAFNDSNLNGIHDNGEPGLSGVTFAITGSQGTTPQTLISGLDGTAKFIGIPGILYTITATPPENMDLIGPNVVSVTPCDKKSVEFLIKSVTPLEINNLVPTDNSTIGSKDVLFAWKTTVNSTSELHLKPESTSNFVPYEGPEGIDHSIFMPNLTRNTLYDFYVKSETGHSSKQSELRRFFISNGIIFVPRYYNFTVNRNVSQSCTVTVKNTDSKAHKLHLNVSNPYNDIYFGFLGYSTSDKEVTLQPGEEKDIDLVIQAQDAMQDRYQFVVNLNSLDPDQILDYALVNVNVNQPHYAFNITEVSTDPFTQVKTLRVTNLEDPITDLSIVPDENLKNGVILQPTIYHSSLGGDGQITFSVSPVWSADGRPIKGNIIATAGNIEKQYPVDFTCGEDRQIYPVKLHDLIMYFDRNINQCINAGPIRGTFFLPPGLKSENVTSGQISFELDPRSPKIQTERYNVWVEVNNHTVGGINNTIPSGRYGFTIEPTYFNYDNVVPALNTYSILNTMRPSYTTMLSDIRVKLCINELTLHICADNQQDAEKIAWTAPWIYRPSSHLNVRILSPENGSMLNTSQPITIRAEVNGTKGGEKHCDVIAAFSNSNKRVWLIDNVQAEDGIYSSAWTPEDLGSCTITVRANNCVGSGSNQTSVIVAPNIQTASNPDLEVTKAIDPSILNPNDIRVRNGTLIKYNITLCPRTGMLKGVKVVDTLPSYLNLDRIDTTDPSIKVSYSSNHDGKAWSTTNVTWEIGDLDTCRSIGLSATFLWKLPGEVHHITGTPLPVSEVTYIGPSGNISKLQIPEGEIKIEPVPAKQPGFETVLALSGLLAIALILKKKK